MSEYKYLYNDNAICPYCDYEDQDSWEWARNSTTEKDVECGSCGKEFHLVIDYSIEYSTSKLDQSDKKEEQI